jgi:ubiquinone/menaquinone biosynthesis C-methylase UbiE
MPEPLSSPSLERLTRQVFDAHHREQARDERIFERLVSLITAEYFGFGPGFFVGRTILDIGCGSNANASVAFLRLGAGHVHSADLGSEWIVPASERLAAFGSRSSVSPQDVLGLTLDAGLFDFVHCAGVLHHTRDPEAGFRELARVTRPGGHTFVTAMGTAGGLIYEAVNRLRHLYSADARFRSAVDALTADDLRRSIEWLLDVKEVHEPSTPAERALLLGFVDDDLVLTIKDRLQAPTYHDFACGEPRVRRWFSDCGFIDVRRISRYPYGFGNVRRFLAPLYLRYENPLSRLLFGDGYVQMIGERPMQPARPERGFPSTPEVP